MTYRTLFFLPVMCTAMYSCTVKTYQTNGEAIYKTGRNLQGLAVLDRKASRIPLVNSCQTCHGKNGGRITRASVRFSDLSDAHRFSVPYNDSLFFRFLDQDLRSDGKKANIGVIWKMSDKDKRDLLAYLKTL